MFSFHTKTLFAFTTCATSLAAHGGPISDLAPSQAQLQAIKVVSSWGCTPMPGTRLEHQGIGLLPRGTARDSKAAMVVALSGFCKTGYGAPGGGRGLIAYQDGKGQVSLSQPFEIISRVRIEADGTVTAYGRKPGQKTGALYQYTPQGEKLIERQP